jgi:uncharacterized protein
MLYTALDWVKSAFPNGRGDEVKSRMSIRRVAKSLQTAPAQTPLSQILPLVSQETLADKIAEMVRRIVERFEPEQIILFGSHARGTARPDSDVDLLIVMPVTGSKHEKQVELRCALHDICVAKDIVVVTPDEVERRRNIVGTIIRPALREGKVLYARGR